MGTVGGETEEGLRGSLKIGRRPTSPPVAADLAVRVESSPEAQLPNSHPPPEGSPQETAEQQEFKGAFPGPGVCIWEGLTAAYPAAFRACLTPGIMQNKAVLVSPAWQPGLWRLSREREIRKTAGRAETS